MMNQENLNKSFAMADSAFEKMWDMWLVGLGSMSWSQEQLENMAKKYLEQRKTAGNKIQDVRLVYQGVNK
jgi:hypothetical protein